VHWLEAFINFLRRFRSAADSDYFELIPTFNFGIPDCGVDVQRADVGSSMIPLVRSKRLKCPLQVCGPRDRTKLYEDSRLVVVLRGRVLSFVFDDLRTCRSTWINARQCLNPILSYLIMRKSLVPHVCHSDD
jgi:hypothetical protein